MTSGSTAGGSRPVPRIDHLMVLVGEAVLAEIGSSGFVEQRFGRVKRKAADSSVAGSYATLGVAGRNTLVELFGSALPSAAPLTGGLVFSFEQPGSSQVAHELLDAAGLRHQHQLVTRAASGGEQQPWYHLINLDLGADSPLLLFLNEVTPEYFESLGAKPAPDGSLLRSAYLDAALDGAGEGPRLLRDITGVTLSVDAGRAARLADALEVFGWVRSSGEKATHLRGEEFEIVLDTAGNGRERVKEITLAVAEEIPGQLPESISFGESCRLLFERPGVARWIFDEPA